MTHWPLSVDLDVEVGVVTKCGAKGPSRRFGAGELGEADDHGG